MSRTLIALGLALVAILITACGGERADTYAGAWTIDKAEMKAQVEAALKEQLKGIQEDLVRQQIEGTRLAIDQTSSSLRLNPGGTYSLVTAIGMQATTRNGTWKPSGSGIVLSTPGQPDVKAHIKGDRLLIENPTGEGPRHTVLIRAAE